MKDKKITMEKTTEKIGGLYIGTIYRVIEYKEGGRHKNVVWCGECIGAKNKREALKYMKGRL